MNEWMNKYIQIMFTEHLQWAWNGVGDKAINKVDRKRSCPHGTYEAAYVYRDDLVTVSPRLK